MSGNKSLETPLGEPVEPKTEFTARLFRHPRIAYYPYPDRGVAVFMVIDEMLISRAAATQLGTDLTALATFCGTVLPENGVPASGEVQIWRLKATPGTKPYPDVAEAVWFLRSLLAGTQIDVAEVGPNHVLVPAQNYHSCPWSPPDEPDNAAWDLGAAVAAEHAFVTVIDSGYVPFDPIDARIQHHATYGEWFAGETVDRKTTYSWVPEDPGQHDPNNLEHDPEGRLGCLVGHANFVAGVVAQACEVATIDVISHSGAFVESDSSVTAIPTEASVARSLYVALHPEEAARYRKVINVGFAFPVLPEIPPVVTEGTPPEIVVKDGPPSWSFRAVLDTIRDRPAVVIVAPAGNQNCSTPQYPAAFYAHGYENVIGVASIEPGGDKSDFSNYGSWVACSTVGRNVVSTFIDTNGAQIETEDAEPYSGGHSAKSFSGWAVWSGTSFAAPKVAGAIAQAATGGGAPLAAWKGLVGGLAKDADLGYRLPQLAPHWP